MIRIPELLIKLPKPLGVKGRSLDYARKQCLRLMAPQHNGQIAYHELLQALIESHSLL